MKLNQYMRLLGFTEAELAKKAGVSQPVINRMRNGRGNWTTALMHKVAQATDGDVTMADLAAAYVPPEKPLRPRRAPKKAAAKKAPKKAPKKSLSDRSRVRSKR